MTEDLLAFVDQGAAAGTRATGRNSLIQLVWVYDRAVDLDGLKRFRDNLARGLLGRRVVASHLPFGRDRWVATTATSPITIAAAPRTRADIDRWLDERAAVPINPWSGPGWHLGVLPLTDGGSAVTLVVSHVLADGVGAAVAAAEAAGGITRELPYPRDSAPLLRSIRRDFALTLRQLPSAARALVEATRIGRDRLEPGETIDPLSAPAHRTGVDRTCSAHIPRVQIARSAEELGVTESTVMFAIAAEIASATGWVQPSDGAAVLGLSVNKRTDGDLRGNAIADAEVIAHPDGTSTSVTRLRSEVRRALSELGDTGRYDVFGPLITLLPRRLLASLIDATPDPRRPVTTCAGVGALPEAVTRADGTPAERMWFRLAWSALPGHRPAARPPYLYVGWTSTPTETTAFTATNLVPDADLTGLVDAATARVLAISSADPASIGGPR